MQNANGMLIHIFTEFIAQEKTNIIYIFILSLVFSFAYTNLSSIVNSNIIQSIHKNDSPAAELYFKYFVLLTIGFLIIYFLYKRIQNIVLTKLAHWSKSELLKIILNANNEELKNINFVEFITPITRISNSCTMLLMEILCGIIPTFAFLVVIFAFFLYKNPLLGLGFMVGNIAAFVYIYFFWQDMFEYKQKQEKKTVSNERYILDILNNLDKVIHKGEVRNEIGIYEKKTDECVDYTIDLMQYISNHTFLMNGFVYLTIFGCLWYLIQLHKSKKIDTGTFITFLSMLFMYRDNMSDTIQKMPSNIESIGRIELIASDFNNMIGNVDISSIMDKTYSDKSNPDIPFDVISFNEVSFKHPESNKYIFKNLSKELYLKDKIIGITGLSGNGKSSFVKLLIRMNKCSSGTIEIDGKNIDEIDPYYIRQNISFVNQNSRLLDRKIMENILYGCKDLTTCNANLREILAYPKIQELYRNVDIDNGDAGPLGEKLSGGQRQVVNIINGLIHPSKILILDEPTNGLDPELKQEVLKIIQNFRKNKKCIMIITHDRDVFSLFDETLEL